nr:hypothetical protein [Methanobrevibacter arboriphilus]
MLDKILQVLLKKLNNNNIDQLLVQIQSNTGYAYSVSSVRTEIQKLINSNYNTELKKFPTELNHLKNKLVLDNSTVLSRRLVDNLKAVEYVTKNTELKISKYRELIQKVPNLDRFKAVRMSAESGINFRGTPYSYNQLERVNEGLIKFRDNRMTYEQQVEAYNMSNERIPILKVWDWSQLENTRHEEMDGEIVGLFELFTVENSITGDVDHFRFPCDFEMDLNRCSNSCGCQCDYHTIQET